MGSRDITTLVYKAQFHENLTIKIGKKEYYRNVIIIYIILRVSSYTYQLFYDKNVCYIPNMIADFSPNGTTSSMISTLH